MAVLSISYSRLYRRQYLRLNARFDNMLLPLLIVFELLLEFVALYYFINQYLHLNINLFPAKILLGPKFGKFSSGSAFGSLKSRDHIKLIANPDDSKPRVSSFVNLPPKSDKNNIPKNVEESPQCPMKLNMLQDDKGLLPDTKFLLPIVKWGPNNQILGFYEAMHLSNYLGTKLVLPPFFFHESDHKRNTQRKTVPGEIRVNTENIPNIVTLEDYKTHCGSSADAVLLATDVLSGSLPTRINFFQEVTGIRIMHLNEKKRLEFLPEIMQYPNITEIKKRYGDGDSFVRDGWKDIFKPVPEKHKCIIFVLPFRTIIKPPRILFNKNEAYEYSPVVKQITNDIITNLGGNIDLGVHWRYNKGDWSHRCSATSSKQPPECKMMSKLNYKKVAEKLCQISKTATGGKNIYIAAPLSEIRIIEQVASNATSGIKIFNSNQMMQYASDKYGACSWFQDYEGEIISLVEQAIMSQVKEFLPWPTSSWSSRINDYRQKIHKWGSRYNLMQVFSESLNE